MGLKLLHRLGLSKLLWKQLPEQPLEVFGIYFPNPVGLAAGLDKNGDYIDALGALGFGFIEVGTVTAKPQLGNPKPRLFRLPEYQAIINRMGFNNKGVSHLVERLKSRRYQGIIGVNIGKNLSTPVEKALDDYLICFREVYAYADYIVVNLSSPNTPGLRNLQFAEQLDELLLALKTEQKALHKQHNKYVPLLVKIAPDLSVEEIQQIAASFLNYGIDGVVATNTTISREAVSASTISSEAGGLSGAPLAEQSNRVVSTLNVALQGKIPVIGVGGIVNAETARARLKAGAQLLQIYTGFIYQGPALIKDIINSLSSLD